MNILVCISNVPDTTTKIRFAEGDTKLDATGVQWVINPWDELSLTRALELKDDSSAGITSVTVIHVGEASSEPTIRKALAIGADSAIRVDSPANDSYVVAAQIAAAASGGGFDIIMCGIESSDFNGSVVGGMVAEMMNIQSVTGVSDLKVKDGSVIMTREIEGGREVVATTAPVLAVVQKGIAKEPRIASMRGIMTARTKPINVVEAVDSEQFSSLEGFTLPPPRPECRFIDADNVSELVSLLQNEAKVI